MKGLIAYSMELIAQNEDNMCLEWAEYVPYLYIVIDLLWMNLESMQINSF